MKSKALFPTPWAAQAQAHFLWASCEWHVHEVATKPPLGHEASQSNMLFLQFIDQNIFLVKLKMCFMPLEKACSSAVFWSVHLAWIIKCDLPWMTFGYEIIIIHCLKKQSGGGSTSYLSRCFSWFRLRFWWSRFLQRWIKLYKYWDNRQHQKKNKDHKRQLSILTMILFIKKKTNILFCFQHEVTA